MYAGLLCKWTQNFIVCMYVCMYVSNVSTGLHHHTSLMNLVVQLILKLDVDFA